MMILRSILGLRNHNIELGSRDYGITFYYLINSSKFLVV